MISPLDPGSLQRGATGSPAQSQALAFRVAIIGAVLLGLFAIVFFRLWFLQVLSGNSLAAQASSNRKRTVPITAPRGDVLDRHGNVLVRNRRAQIVELAPGALPAPEREIAAKYGQRLSKWSTLISRAYSAKKFQKWTDEGFPDSVRRQFPKPSIPKLSDPNVIQAYIDAEEPAALPALRKRYERLAGVLQIAPDEVRRRVIKSLYLLPYAAIPLSKEATDQVVWYIAENAEQFEGVSTTQRFVRSYPHHKVAAQLFGQVGSVPIDPETNKATYTKYRTLNPASQVGLNGLELKYDTYLRGQDGEVQSTVDAAGNVIGDPVVQPPKAGDKVQLTLDLALSERARKSLAPNSQFNPEGLPGAAVAIDPRDGAVLAMASNPSFDPAEFVRGVSDARFQEFINGSGGKPLFNRVLQGGYASGSTFKPVTAFSALAEGKITPSELIADNGFIKFGDDRFQNAGGQAYGSVDLKKSIQVSSDVYYYTLGARLNTRVRRADRY
jgi:penicillin-binding protein 2